jgi:hypothetical protein
MKMKKGGRFLLTVLAGVSLLLLLTAQKQQFHRESSYIAKTFNGKQINVVNSVSNFSFSNLYYSEQVPKTLWTKSYGGQNRDMGFSSQQISDGGFIITGTTTSFGDKNGDLLLIKTNENGESMWTKTFGGSMSDNGRYIKETADKGFIIIGHTDSFGNGLTDIWLIKTDQFGDTVWTRTFGGEYLEYGSVVEQTNDGGYILIGSTYTPDKQYGHFEAWVIKVNALGDTIWTKSYGGQDVGYGRSILQISNGGYMMMLVISYGQK